MSKEIYSKVSETARKPEREYIGKFIEDIKDELSGTPFFLNLFAPAGFGKSAFLEQIWKQYESNLPTSIVHVREFLGDDTSEIFQRKFLLHVIHQLGERLPKRVTPQDYEDFKDDEELGQVFLKFVAGAKEFEKVTLLLVDDYDLIPDKQRRWLQTNIFSPASQIRSLAVVLTSATELRFTENFELRMKLNSRELDGIGTEAISAALPDYEEVAEVIHRITGGLPSLTEELIKELNFPQVTDPQDFQTRIQEFTNAYYRTYVESKILAELTPPIRETILVLSLLRRFDVKILKEILPDLLPESYRGLGTADYLEVIDSMRPWVQWRQQGGYTLNPAFRLMLQEYVWTSRPELFKTLNLAAENLYREWLGNEYNKYYLVEFLFHALSLYKAEKENATFFSQYEINQAEVGIELLGYLKGTNGEKLNYSDLHALQRSLEQDLDLKNYISDSVKIKLEKLVIKKRKEMAEQSTNTWNHSVAMP